MVISRMTAVYVAAESHTVAYPRRYKPSSRRPVVVFTGGPGDDRDFLTSTASGNQVYQALAGYFPLFSAQYGGASQWGNSTAVTRIGQGWTQAKSQLGTPTDKFVGVGTSKGFTALANYAKANPSNVSALVGLVPAVDIQDIYTNDRGGAAASISTAFGGAPPDASTPAKNTAALAAIPHMILASDNDPTCVPATITAYCTGVGVTPLSIGSNGHDASTAPTGTVIDFVRSYA